MRLLNDFSVSALAAGFVTVLVGFTSSAVIVFQAAQALGRQSEPRSLRGCGRWVWAWA